jgi:hypothetical protein
MSLPMSDLSQIDLTQKNQHGVDLSREVTQATIDLYASRILVTSGERSKF